MDKFSDYKKYFEIDIMSIIVDILNTNESKRMLINYNQESQLSKGIDAKGQRIETIASQEQNSGFPYSRYTVKLRGESGLQVTNVDLKDTGEFWKSFDVKVTNESTEIFADFNKPDGNIMDNFERRFDFLGLTDENLEGFVWNYLFDILAKRLESQFEG